MEGFIVLDHLDQAERAAADLVRWHLAGKLQYRLDVVHGLEKAPAAVPRTFTQDNVLDERTDAVLPRHVLLNKGMTLDQLGGLLALQLLNVEVRHAGDATLMNFAPRLGNI